MLPYKPKTIQRIKSMTPEQQTEVMQRLRDRETRYTNMQTAQGKTVAPEPIKVPVSAITEAKSYATALRCFIRNFSRSF